MANKLALGPLILQLTEIYSGFGFIRPPFRDNILPSALTYKSNKANIDDHGYGRIEEKQL
jgi:hypothetical protein